MSSYRVYTVNVDADVIEWTIPPAQVAKGITDPDVFGENPVVITTAMNNTSARTLANLLGQAYAKGREDGGAL